MAFDKKILADSFVAKLIESQSIFSKMNRTFDPLVRQGASSVDIPNLAIPEVKTAGTPLVDASRKKTHTDTTMVNIPLTKYAVPLADELLGAYESNGTLLTEYINSSVMVLQEKLDALTIAAAQATTDKTAFGAASMAWGDIIDINKRFDVNKVPKAGRVIVVDANLAAEFFGIDVIKNAVSYNSNFLTTGTMLQFMGNTFFITGVAPTITIASAQKYTMVGIYGPGLAVIINKMGDIKEAWDSVNLQTVYDVICHAGVGLFDNKFAVVKYKP